MMFNIDLLRTTRILRDTEGILTFSAEERNFLSTRNSYDDSIVTL
jgi:hypothetical protein